MKANLKKLRDQVIVITGASSGIGLATARMAARRGAKLVLSARNESELRNICEEIQRSGGAARWVVADVAREQDVRRVAAEAVGHFGRFDTWVNNAGVSIYGRILDTPVDDARRLFDTNFWGVVYGSRAAAEHLRHSGGALINVGSVVSDVAVPLQGFYSASKHAVKGFTDALRMELEEQNAPVSVTLIKPAAIDTPYTQHAKNLLEDEPTHTPPVYDPDLVAEAILHAAEHPVRDLMVGGGAKLMSVMGRYMPRVADKYMEKMQISGTHSGRPRERTDDALHSPSFGGEERGNYQGMTRRTSAYTSAAMHPLLAGALGLGATLALGAMVKGRERVKS
jgi:short-subunit dehydrogenase